MLCALIEAAGHEPEHEADGEDENRLAHEVPACAERFVVRAGHATNQVAEEDGEEEHREHLRPHPFGGGRDHEVEADDRQAHLGHPEHHVGRHLPPERRLPASLDHEAADTENGRGRPCEQEPDEHLVGRRVVDLGFFEFTPHQPRERNEDHDQCRVEPLDRVRFEPVALHLLGHGHPRRVILIVDKPEEDVADEDAGEALHDTPVLGGVFGCALDSRGVRSTFFRIVLAPQPEDDERHDHETGWEQERRLVAVARAHPRHREHGDHGADVDGGVEIARGLGAQLDARASFFVHARHEREHVRLDRSRPHGQERERQVQPRLGPPLADDDVAEDVGEREDEHGLELAEPAIGDVAAQDRQHVRQRLEGVGDETCLA